MNEKTVTTARTRKLSLFWLENKSQEKMNYFEFVTSENDCPDSSLKLFDKEIKKKKADSKKTMLSQEQHAAQRQKSTRSP
jgi:hypothetical protein